MKKLNCIVMCLLLLLLTACSVSENSNASIITKNEDAIERSLIESSDYYKLYDNTLSETLEIYNSKGELVRTITTEEPISITMLNKSIIEISIGKGTGLTKHTYYSVKLDDFSDDFSYVICASNELIAYVGISKDGLDNKTLIVQNIFNENRYYKEFIGAFDQVDTYELSSMSGEFSQDFSTLTVHYYLKNQQQISKSFNL